MKSFVFLLALAATALYPAEVWPQGSKWPPAPPGRMVADYAGLLQRGEATRLEQALRTFRQQSSNEIAIVILPRVPSEVPSVEEAALQLAQAWGIGSEKDDNGILLAVFVAERRVRIEVGYGLEGAVPDLKARSIIENQITPAFRQQQYYQGLATALNELMPLAGGEFNQALQPRKRNATGKIPLWAVVGLIALVGWLLYWARRHNRHATGKGYDPQYRRQSGGYYDSGPSFFIWGGGWGGGHGGGDSSGGWGGGGSDFGGFGGGDFGGGGASGDW